MNHIEGTFPGPQEIPIYYQGWQPEGDPKAVLLLVHGLAEHSGRYGNVVDYFVPRGYAVYALDHVGHGKSGGTRVHVDKFLDFLTPIETLFNSIQEWKPDRPVFLIGHSLGSLIGASYLLIHQEELAGAVLTGVLAEIPDHINPLTRFAAGIFSTLFPKMGLTAIDTEGLSKDPDVIEAYENDPLVTTGKSTARLGAEIISALQYLNALGEEITLPLLLLQGSDDPIVNPHGAQHLYELVDSEDKTLTYYEGLYHEIFNEPERDQVLQDVKDWLQRQLEKTG
jgi:alpha-beta hydrolase superfamily lysophospholipase